MALKLSTEQKAWTYLADGRVKVINHGEYSATIRVTGSSSSDYVVTFHANAWSCTCPATTKCAHIIAAELISPLRPVKNPSFHVE